MTVQEVAGIIGAVAASAAGLGGWIAHQLKETREHQERLVERLMASHDQDRKAFQDGLSLLTEATSRLGDISTRCRLNQRRGGE